jgi:hypothetical protein
MRIQRPERSVRYVLAGQRCDLPKGAPEDKTAGGAGAIPQNGRNDVSAPSKSNSAPCILNGFSAWAETKGRAMTVELGIPGVSVDPGSHICAFYSGDSERDEILIPFLREALATGDRSVCLVDRAATGVILEALDVDPSTKSDLESNWLELMTSAETYIADGTFDPARMLAFWTRIFEETKAKGWSFVRIISEMSWIMRDLPGVEDFVVYEAKYNRVSKPYPQVTICMYDLNVFGAKLLITILTTHPQVLVGNAVHENPYYLEPDEFLAGRDDDPPG